MFDVVRGVELRNNCHINTCYFAIQQNLKNNFVGQNSPLKWNFVTFWNIENFDIKQFTTCSIKLYPSVQNLVTPGVVM